MKNLLLVIAIGVFAIVAHGQNKEIYIDVQFDRFKNPKDKLVVTGLSTAEVKVKIGNPKAVESGFPDSREKVIDDMPKMVGQMNYSCWFYMYEAQDILLPTSNYLVNGEPVDEEFYLGYKGKKEVYYVDGELIRYDVATSYKITKSNRLKSEILNPETTKAEKSNDITVKMVPIYCVIFDKGTQVVAGTRAFFHK